MSRMFKLGAIHKGSSIRGRPHQRGRGSAILPNADATVNFACKRNVRKQGGGGQKRGQIMRTSLMDGP